MRVLLVVLLVGITGCGETDPNVAALNAVISESAQPGAEIHRNEQGEVIAVNLCRTKITDAGLVHFKNLARLQELHLYNTQITDAGLVQLTGLSSLRTLMLEDTRITNGGISQLRKALPNCDISR